jgi:hypothetical protein
MYLSFACRHVNSAIAETCNKNRLLLGGYKPANTHLQLANVHAFLFVCWIMLNHVKNPLSMCVEHQWGHFFLDEHQNNHNLNQNNLYHQTEVRSLSIIIWGFPKMVPPVLIHLVRWIFHETIQLWGYPHDGLATPQADGHRPIRAPHQAVEMRTSTCDGKSPFMSKRLKGDRSGWSHYDLIMIFFIIIWMIHNHWYDWYEIRNDKNVSYVS